jgi:uncharacterized protein YjiK
MPAFLTFKRLLIVLVAVALLLIAVAGQHFRLFERAWFNVTQSSHSEQWRDRALWLPEYSVTIEAKPVEGIGKNLSALTYDAQRKSLFSVTNADPMRIVELSLDGELLRSIELEGFQDPEAIEYIAPGHYVITDERHQSLIEVHLNDKTQVVRAADGKKLSISIDTNGNKGFEGLAYDATGKRLLVAKERDPIRIYEISGFPGTGSDSANMSVQVGQDPERDKRLFVRDLSSLDFDEGTGHLLVLSDESRLVLELDAGGKPISSLSLLEGQHGLKESVPQAEGLATDGNGVLYLTSEPNLFYRFEKKLH